MFEHYLLLAGLVLAVVLAVIFGSLSFSLLCGDGESEDSGDEENLKREKLRSVMAIVAGAATIACSAVGYMVYQHLITEDPVILVNFGYWYVTGFISRLPLLYYKDFIFHPYFSTEWDEVFPTFFTALLGPLQIPFTVWGIWKHRPWY